MSSAVAEAREWAKVLVHREMNGPGDLPNAMRRVERRHGIPYSMLYSLRYRPPKDMLISAYLRLREAYLAECERQEKLLRHEREIASTKTLAAAALVRAADAVAREED